MEQTRATGGHHLRPYSTVSPLRSGQLIVQHWATHGIWQGSLPLRPYSDVIPCGYMLVWILNVLLHAQPPVVEIGRTNDQGVGHISLSESYIYK